MGFGTRLGVDTRLGADTRLDVDTRLGAGTRLGVDNRLGADTKLGIDTRLSVDTRLGADTWLSVDTRLGAAAKLDCATGSACHRVSAGDDAIGVGNGGFKSGLRSRICFGGHRSCHRWYGSDRSCCP